MMRGFVERGLIFEKNPEAIRSGLRVDFRIIRGVFFAKYPERESGARVDFRKAEGFFRKMTAARPIWAVRAADRTATKSGRRGHAGWPATIIKVGLYADLRKIRGGFRKKS